MLATTAVRETPNLRFLSDMGAANPFALCGAGDWSPYAPKHNRKPSDMG